MPMYHTGICVLFVIYLLFRNEAISCIRKYTNRPLNGYHCAHGHYANFTNTSRPYCTRTCLRDRQCASISFNMEINFCQLSHKPCAVAEADPGFVLMNFRLNEDENCVTWESNGVETGGTLPERLVERFISIHAAVGRIQIGENIHVGQIDFPAVHGNGYFAVEGIEHYEHTNYKLLTVSSNCSLAWVPYTTGNTLPRQAVVAGYLSGWGPTYSIRVWRPDLGSMMYGVYVTGDHVARYCYYGVVTVSELEILVQVWFVRDHSQIIHCAFIYKREMLGNRYANLKLVAQHT